MNIEQALMNLVNKRALFHSEADFQHALALELQQMYPEANIRLEYKPPEVKSRIYLDIWMNQGGQKIAIELKYKTKSMETVWNNEAFNLLNHGAQDCGRYDYLKDIMRLEHVVRKEKDAVGYAIFVTNDPAYWSEAETNSVDRAFRIPDGRNVYGELSWGEEASAGTMRGRERPILLRGRYSVKWETFSQFDCTNGHFRCLCLKVEPSKKLDIESLMEQLAVV